MLWTRGRPGAAPAECSRLHIQRPPSNMPGDLRLFKVNVDESPDVAQLLNVRGIPALFTSNPCGKLLDQRSGLMSADQLSDWIQNALAKID